MALAARQPADKLVAAKAISTLNNIWRASAAMEPWAGGLHGCGLVEGKYDEQEESQDHLLAATRTRGGTARSRSVVRRVISHADPLPTGPRVPLSRRF